MVYNNDGGAAEMNDAATEKKTPTPVKIMQRCHGSYRQGRVSAEPERARGRVSFVSRRSRDQITFVEKCSGLGVLLLGARAVCAEGRHHACVP